MGLQCFLFTSDEGIAETIRLILAGLDVQGEFCSEAVTAAERIANQSFQIVIIDWDKQPEAGLLLTTARQRKASERPITLAIVSDDASVPKALQAGANSILRKPIVVSQAKDTLVTARDLLRSKREPAQPLAVARPAAGSGSSNSSAVDLSANMQLGKEKTLRAGEFLHSAAVAPGGSFETESDVSASMHEPVPEPVDPLTDLEPVASSMAEKSAAPETSAQPPAGEPRGLEWYLKNRGISRPGAIVPNSAHAAAAAPAPAPEKPELVGFEQTPSQSAPATGSESGSSEVSLHAEPGSAAEQKKEAELFSYIEGQEGENEDAPKRSFRPGKGMITAIAALVVCAVVAAPQMPWHPKVQVLWLRGQRVLHTWLNPQPVTPTSAPASHESFARAGDEYKLPAAEPIPDATTDPSQIQVVPVVDPTKKPTDAANQAAVPTDGTATTPVDQPQTPGVQPPNTQPAQTVGEPTTAESTGSIPLSVPPASVQPAPVQPAATTPTHVEAPAQVPAQSVSSPTPAKAQPARLPSIPGNIPSSIKSQLAPNTPDPTGPKSPDTGMASFEPVAVAESAERALLLEQPTVGYPANIKNQQGTVILQVLVGRDGTVQEAKFLQGSLAFARTAIDGVKQWKFRPYTMNGRAVSVQTLLTLTFKPTP